MTPVGQVYCQPLNPTSPKQLPESCSGPAAPCSQVRGVEGGVDVCYFGGLLQVQGGHQRLLVAGACQLRIALLQEETTVRGMGTKMGDRDTPVLPRNWGLSRRLRCRDTRGAGAQGAQQRGEDVGCSCRTPCWAPAALCTLTLALRFLSSGAFTVFSSREFTLWRVEGGG